MSETLTTTWSRDKGFIELLLEPLCLQIHSLRFFRFTQQTVYFGHLPLSIVNVTLHFGHGNRSFGQGAVGERYRVVGILPALVQQTFAGTTLVLDKTISIGITIVVDPMESCLGSREVAS